MWGIQFPIKAGQGTDRGQQDRAGRVRGRQAQFIDGMELSTKKNVITSIKTNSRDSAANLRPDHLPQSSAAPWIPVQVIGAFLTINSGPTAAGLFDGG